MPAPPRIPIIIDTREQDCWYFDSGVFACERGTLATGDYTIKGLQETVCMERKSVGDFVGTVIHQWIRFRKELIRMSAFDVAAIVVEGDVSDVLQKRYESDANPTSVMGRAASIYLDHGIPVFFWGAKRFCEPLVWQFLRLTAERYWGPPAPVVEVGLGVAAGDPKLVKGAIA